MRYFFLSIFLCFIVSGCGVDKEQNESLLPREYYRTILRNEDIGVAVRGNEEDINAIIPELINNEMLSDAFLLKHNGEAFIGVKIKPYHRNNRNEILHEISRDFSVKINNIIDDPRKYRQMESLLKEKQTSGINDQWLSEWEKLIEDK